MSPRSPSLIANSSSADNIVLTLDAQQVPPPCSFLDLPQELRDQVYHEVFQFQDSFEVYVPAKPHQKTCDKNHIVFVVSYTPQDLKATSKIDHRRPRGMNWVLANNQICQEAIGHFHREATWAVLDPAFRGPFGMTSHWSQPYHLHHTAFQPRLFVPMSARHIVVYDSIAVIPRPEGECDGKPNWHIQTDWHFIDRLVLGLHNTNNLQNLTIALHTEIYATQEEALEQASDDISISTSMGRLDVFNAPNLRKIEFKIKYSAEFEARRDFVSAFEEYLNEVGMYLIGGKGVMTSRNIRTLPREAVYTYTRTRAGG